MRSSQRGLVDGRGGAAVMVVGVDNGKGAFADEGVQKFGVRSVDGLDALSRPQSVSDLNSL